MDKSYQALRHQLQQLYKKVQLLQREIFRRRQAVTLDADAKKIQQLREQLDKPF